MAYDHTNRSRPEEQGAAESQPSELDLQHATTGEDAALEREVAAALSFFRWAEDDEDVTPLSDAQAEYARRMSADLEVPAERLARMREQVLGPRSPHAPLLPPPNADAVPTPPADEGADDARSATGRLPTGLATAPGAPTGHGATPRPNFGRRCRELKRKIGEVARELRVNHEVLLELEHGHARRIPRAFLQAAADFVDFDAPTLARCFAPNTGDVARMAAHDQSGRRPSTPAITDFLAIIEESDLPGADKQYWREVVRAEELTHE